MSDATYSITTTHDPHSKTYPWDSRIVRLSDDELVQIAHGETMEEAESVARVWVAEELSRSPIARTVYVDVDGRVVDLAVDYPEPAHSPELVDRIAQYGQGRTGASA